MGGDAGIVALGIPYARIFLLFTPFFMCNYIVSAFVRNDGAPSLAMVATLSGSLFNVVFDYIFMFPMGLGLAGAALATAVSPILSIAICSRHFFQKDNTVQFVRQLPSAKLLGQSCQLGISGFVGEMSSGVTTTVFNFLLLGLAGNVAVAAYGVVANFALVATAIFNGVAQGAQPLVSRCYGHSDRAGARKLLILGSCTALALAAVLYAVVFGMTDTLVGWFNSENSAQMARFAHNGMRLYFVGYFFAGFNIVAAGYLSATNRPLEASVTSICRGVAAIVVCSLVMSALFGMNGVWAAFLVTSGHPWRISLPFSKEEIKKVWEHQKEPWVDTVLILLYSGWRISELLNLKPEDIKPFQQCHCQVRAAAAAPCRASARPAAGGDAPQIPPAFQGRSRAGHPPPCHRRRSLCGPAAAHL